MLAGVLALTTAAAATGAAAAAGSYGLYKYFKKKASQRKRRQEGDFEDDGQELEVYNVTETKIPPPVPPKPKRRGERSPTVVTEQPGGLPAVADRDREGAGSSGRASASHHDISNEAFIMRLCPNAVKVLPDPPPAKLTAALSPTSTADSCRQQGSTNSSSNNHKGKNPEVDVVIKTQQNKQKDLRSGNSNDIISMKTPQRKLDEEYV